MSKTEHYQEDIFHQYLDRELDQHTRQKFEAHLSQCPNCAGRLENIQTLFQAVSGLPEVELGVDLSQAVIRSISKEKPALNGFKRIAYLQIAVAVALLVVAYPYLAQLGFPDIEIEIPQITIQPLVLNIDLAVTQVQELIGTFQIPSLLDLIPEVPFPEPSQFSLSTVYLTPLLVSAGLLWWFGNRIFLVKYPINGG